MRVISQFQQNLKRAIAGLSAPLQSVSSPTHFFWLDAIRGLAAMAVVLRHYQHFFIYDQTEPKVDLHNAPFFGLFGPMYLYGYAAVYLFWVMSGFILTANYARPLLVAARSFFVNRFARLYPLHLLTLLMVAGLQLLSLSLFGHYQIWFLNDVYHFVLHLFLLSAWDPGSKGSFNEPIWSISVELAIYMLFYALLPVVVKRGYALFLILVVLFLGGVLLRLPGAWFIKCGAYFFMGSLIYFLWSHFHGFPWLLTGLGLILITAALAIALVFPRFAYSETQFAVLWPGVVIVLAAMDSLGSLRLGQALSPIGDLTYSIYLLHTPVQIAIILAIDSWGWSRNLALGGGFFALYWALLLAMAYLSFRYVEVPARKWLRTFA